MDITIIPSKLSGTVSAIPSKSQAHRMLICAAFADKKTEITCSKTSRDIEATVQCLNALGAHIQRSSDGYSVIPAVDIPESAMLPCHDSGSTLRFLLPIVGALGVNTTFLLEGRLAQRPLSPLWEVMQAKGCQLSRPTNNSILCQGKLHAGEYSIDGSISSQFITGLLLAFPLLNGDSRIFITGKLESASYVAITQHVISLFGVSSGDYHISGKQKYRSPGSLCVEGDWSNGAFFLASQYLDNPVLIENLSLSSTQGDKAIHFLLPELQKNITISAADIPDLIPILSVVAACQNGAVFTDVGRLKLKESDRIASVIHLLQSLGGNAEMVGGNLVVYGTGLMGGIVNSFNDHRISMSAAIASTVCKSPVTILGAECVEKSYPQFWDEFRRLGGKYEQHLR